MELVTITFTKAEAECLLHRAEAPDAVCEVMVGQGYSAGEVGMYLETIAHCLRTTRKVALFHKCCKEVLAELVEGSTWAAVHMDGFRDPAGRSAIRTLRALRRKIEPAVGRKLVMPAGCS